VVQKKIAQSLITIIVQPFATESSGFHQNAQKRSSVYQSMQTYISWLIFFDKQLESDTYLERRRLHVNTTPLTVEDRLLIKALQNAKG